MAGSTLESRLKILFDIVVMRYDGSGKFQEEIDFLKEQQRIVIFPYKKIRQTGNVISGYDPLKKLPYVIHKNRRLYFASRYSETDTVNGYKSLIEVENILGGNYAEKTPHQYQTESFHVINSDILLDIGCAEALFTLDVIDTVKQAVLFESDAIWYEPLKATFEKEIASGKVILIEKYAGKECNSHSVTVDSVLKNGDYESLFIKMDIEGNEVEVVKSCENLMKTNKNIRFSCCTYHREHDAKILQSIFESNGYYTEFSEGYMLFIFDEHIKYPYFRKGIIRASNIKIPKMIPRIIHQIWSEKYKPLPAFFTILAETWKEKHPEWKYIYWNEEKINSFMQKEYPHLCDFYYSMPFDIQRWDAVRFLILYKMGGMYADFDYECLENMEPLLENRTCCIGLEPETHCKMYDIPYVLNGALLACAPENAYLKKVIDRIFSETAKQFNQADKPAYILHTTGPLMLSEVYENLAPEEKEPVYLIPAKHAMPFDIYQIAQLKAGVENEELENCLQEAYAVHYFSNTWIPELSIKTEK